MHLRRGRNQKFVNGDQGLTPEEAALLPPIELAKAEPCFDWERARFPKELRDLAKQRKQIAKKIYEIENRLRFGYSEPLHDYKMELVKEDIGLACQMTDGLLQLKK